MAFTLSVNLITQTGTDANLSGLGSVAGVTRITANGQNFYNLGNLDLTISGTLTIDPEVEELFFNIGGRADGRLTVSGTGVLGIGREINIGAAVNRFSSGTWVRFSRANDNNYSEVNSDFKVLSGGVVNWYGGALYSKRIIAFMEGSTVRTYSRNAQIIGQHNAEFQIRQRSVNTQINGLTTKGYFVSLIRNPAAFNGWQPFDTPNMALSFSVDAPDATFITLRDFDPSGVAGQQIAVWSSVWGRLINNQIGSSVVCQGNNDSGDNRGLYEIRQELFVRCDDLAGAPLSTPKLYLRDFDNGLRLGPSLVGTANPSYLADRTYTAQCNASGEASFTADGGVLVAVKYRTVAAGLRTANNFTDFRCSAGNDSDVFNVRFADYLNAFAATPVTLKGNGAARLIQTMIPDLLVTEQSKSVVDAYTDIDTAAKLYDRAKSWLYDNFAGETQTLISRSGELVDLLAMNLVIDASAASAFAVAGNTLTIRAGVFSGSLATTGLITLQNGAVVTGVRTDANGTVAPAVTYEVTGLVPGSEVRFYTGTDPATAVEVAGIESSTDQFQFVNSYGGQAGYFVVFATGYQTIRTLLTYPAANASIPIQQTIDRVFENA